ncbi:LOW QUALITY PROTEIN: lamina-associated polypeptide 2, isoforms beta/gamma-like [Hippoglossus hippoglossus]|uniref:LOW QUALITY PROTEIN: lamina-associated polypeptide 2, isoforms beta/gamma-like n=1 Tax=Hippoglossus hippoglossus TaxID=8267 RepID=UPI00148E1573|nr:LOW QUALITY PROTEIN: lamina-associated polypeptide 2, isoforms beta/gamma-like [Hippoglossus hippoglossus]
MPVLVEEPALLSKSRLRSDFVAHNVKLHLKHIDHRNAAEFSSDEEEDVQDEAEKEEKPEEAEMPDLSGLTDDDLKAALLRHGFKPGPIVASTRALYEKKLSRLLRSNGHNLLNAAEKVMYSASEEEEEEEEENGEDDDAESGAEEEKQEAAEQSDEAQPGSSQIGGFFYPQCFLPSSRLRARASRNKEPSPAWNSGNALKSSEQSRPRCSQIPVGISRASSVDHRPGLGSGVQAGSQTVAADASSSFTSPVFSITEMVEEMESRGSLSTSSNTVREFNRSNGQEHCSGSSRLDTPVVDSSSMKNHSVYCTPRTSPHKRGMKPPREPVNDTFKDLLPAETTPTGIYATLRSPIKGAAGRPVQYVYPDLLSVPRPWRRRVVERRLVPIHIRFCSSSSWRASSYLIYELV